jgi:hypothetical protein
MNSDLTISNVRRMPSLEISPRFSTTDQRRAWLPSSRRKTTQDRGGWTGKRLASADWERVYSGMSTSVESAWIPGRPLSSCSRT